MTLRFSLLKTLPLAALSLTAGVLSVHAQSPWVVRHQHTGGDDLWGVATNGSTLVAVGTNGAILQSTDGRAWTRRPSGTNDWLTGVAFGNSRFVAVGDHGRILSSADGVNWSAGSQSATTQRLNNVAYGHGKFVAVGEAGTVLTSSDGANWTASPSGTTAWLRGLAYGQASEIAPDGLFGTPAWIATGQAGTLLTSSDAVTWRSIDSGTTGDLESAAYVIGNHSHPIAAPGGGHIVFTLTGAPNTARVLDLNASDGAALITPTLTPFPFQTPARIRASASGARTFNHYLVSGALSVGEEVAAPTVLIDEAGGALANYTGTGMGQWLRDVLPTTAPMRAVAYSGAQNSFFAVGSDETIVQRDQVFNGRLGNISTRGFVDSAGTSLIAGFVVRGGTPKRLLGRGIGPGLADFGLTTGVALPTLRIYDANGAVLTSNTGWNSTPENAAAVTNADLGAGAFPLGPTRADSALVITLPPGLYSAQVAEAGGTFGVTSSRSTISMRAPTVTRARSICPRMDRCGAAKTFSPPA